MISPLQQEKPGVERCMVKHMMTVDWKNWKTFFRPTINRDMTLTVLERVAGVCTYFLDFKSWFIRT